MRYFFTASLLFIIIFGLSWYSVQLIDKEKVNYTIQKRDVRYQQPSDTAVIYSKYTMCSYIVFKRGVDHHTWEFVELSIVPDCSVINPVYKMRSIKEIFSVLECYAYEKDCNSRFPINYNFFKNNFEFLTTKSSKLGYFKFKIV